MKIELHIAELVLDGFPLDRRASDRLEAALVAQLGELLARGHLDLAQLQSHGERPLQAPALEVPRGYHVATLGHRIAGSLHAALSAPQTDLPRERHKP